MNDDSTRVALDFNHLKVLRGETRPLDLRQLVGPEAIPFLESPDRYIIKSQDELTHLSDELMATTPYSDLALRHRPTMIKFLKGLQRVGLLGFRRTAHSFAGASTVAKKDSQWQRLVLDARATNFCHRRAPYVCPAFICRRHRAHRPLAPAEGCSAVRRGGRLA